jgi:hypothetical protein
VKTIGKRFGNSVGRLIKLEPKDQTRSDGVNRQTTINETTCCFKKC